MAENTFNYAFRTRLAHLDHRQLDAAGALRVSENTLNAWANGRWLPESKYLPRIAAYLNVDGNRLLKMIASHVGESTEAGGQ